MRLVLASRSPRRKALLEAIGIEPLVVPSKFDESRFDPSDMSPRELAMALARGKTAAVAREYPDDVVLGADTIVVLDGKVLGKPATPTELHKCWSTFQETPMRFTPALHSMSPNQGRCFAMWPALL